MTWEDQRSGGGLKVYFNIPLGVQPYGIAKPGAGAFAPTLSSAGVPARGNTPSLEVTDGLGGAPAVLLLGAGPASKIALPLWDGTLLVSPATSIPFALDGSAGAPGEGSASLPFPIPDHAWTVGVNLNFQVILVDPAATFSLTMTGGLEMWIG